MKRIAIIILNWNGKTDTLECLKSLSLLNKKDLQVKTIVVDNASSDDSVSSIKKVYPRVALIALSTNKGFTGGYNAGISSALGHDVDAVWLLNNDTVVHKNALLALVEICNERNIGIAGSKIYFYPGKEFHENRYRKQEKGKIIWYAGGIIDWKNIYASHRGVDEVDIGQYDVTVDTDFVSGCSMLIKREVLESIGKLDDNYFLYLEDLDFCLRAKQKGFRLVYIPESIVWHKNASSTDRPGNDLQSYYMIRNRLYFGMKYATFRTKLALLKDALRQYLRGTSIIRGAIRDYFLRRLGKQYLWQ